jgi:hypothetical protein
MKRTQRRSKGTVVPPEVTMATGRARWRGVGVVVVVVAAASASALSASPPRSCRRKNASTPSRTGAVSHPGAGHASSSSMVSPSSSSSGLPSSGCGRFDMAFVSFRRGEERERRAIAVVLLLLLLFRVARARVSVRVVGLIERE